MKDAMNLSDIKSSNKFEFLESFLFQDRVFIGSDPSFLFDPARLEFQQLEWVGDSILNIYISSHIFH